VDTKAVRALAKDLGPCWLADTLNQCADELDALKEDAARYRWLRDEWFIAGHALPWEECDLECPASNRLDEAIDRARKGTT
jgi:hypothetical protein